ncbi:MAG TPA: cupredoxin domain-containing protein [Longimicrobiales bacterium]|nr:cupredoxin domain-containing protein [Longimicrobiales bacterium]
METGLPAHPEGQRHLPPPERPTEGGGAPLGGVASPDYGGLLSASGPPERSPRRRIRRAAAGALLLATVAAASWLILGPGGPGGAPGSGPHVVQIEMDMMGFEPSSIRVRAGETVTLRLHTPENPFQLEGPTHQLAIDELGVDLQVGGGETAEATITPSEAGTYVFYCDLCCSGRANPSMRGELVVSG